MRTRRDRTRDLVRLARRQISRRVATVAPLAARRVARRAMTISRGIMARLTICIGTRMVARAVVRAPALVLVPARDLRWMVIRVVDPVRAIWAGAEALGRSGSEGDSRRDTRPAPVIVPVSNFKLLIINIKLFFEAISDRD